jgi:putative addiction module component (TIGR02574 family)
MSETAQAILAAALSLPEEEREELVERLMESLPPSPDDLGDEALLAELERRRAEHERDPSVVIPWSEFRWDAPP